MTANQHVSHHAPQTLRFRKTALALALSQVLALSAPAALAATIDVGVLGCTLEDAITAANSESTSITNSCSLTASTFTGPDTINLHPDNTTITLSAPLPVVTSTITVEGNGATIQGNNSFRIFEVNNGSLELQNTTISGGSANFGGGIFVNNGILTLTNSTVSGNSAYYDGGGIYAHYSTVTLTNSTVSGNSAHFYGGGIVVSSNTASSINSTLTLTNSTVSGNSARYDGGGILAYRSVVQIDDSDILNNNLSGPDGGTHASHGGGIYALHSTVTLANSTISNNIVSGPSGSFGGGIYARSSTVTLTDSTISTNTANTTVQNYDFGYGGGISAVSSDITLTNSTVSGNSADANGGGIFAKYNITGTPPTTNSTITLMNSTVSGNTATGAGGGIFAKYFMTVKLTNSTVSGNYANDVGGGVAAADVTMTLTNSTVSGNTVSGSSHSYGGGIYVMSFASTLTLTNSTISGNTAVSGGGVFFGKYNPIDKIQKKHRARNKSNVASPRATQPGSSFTLQNTIIANSTGGDCISDIAPTGTHNLIGDGNLPANLTRCGITPLTNDPITTPNDPMFTGDPNLGSLANNGGPTQTHALKKGSPAIDQISSAGGCGVGVTTDQRGVTRPQGATSPCDIGAFEVRAPTAANDSYSVVTGQPSTIPSTTGVLFNDTNPENSSDNPLTAIKVSDPTHGSVTLNSDGSFTYTPASGFVGADSFTYKANNGTDSAAATVIITITNDAPVATDDSYSTARNQPLTVAAAGVLSNDTDPNSDALTAIKVSNPAHGTVTLNSDGSFTYTPTTDYVGTDSFTYKANDGNADSNTATVMITISSSNSGVPTANPDSYSTRPNQTLTVPAPGVLSNDNANGNTTLTVIQVSGPSHGTLNLQSNGGFVYTPNTGFVGQDTFTYQVNGRTVAADQPLSKAKASGVIAADGVSAPATVTITISAEIPTLSQWAQMAAAALLTLLGWLGLRRRVPD